MQTGDEAQAYMAWQTAAAAYPTFTLPSESFVPRLLDLASTHQIEMEKLFANDLYLAEGCIRGLPQAVAMFEKLFGIELRKIISRVEKHEHAITERVQSLMVHLLVGDDARPKLADYS